MDKIFIGIDPGKTNGAIVVIKGGKIIDKLPTPILGKDIDILTTARFLAKYKKRTDVHAVMEKLHGMPNQKLSVIWVLSGHCHILKTLLVILQIPWTEITPQTWQKEMFKGVKIQEKVVKGKLAKDTKKTSILACQKLFPGQDIRKTKRSTTPNDGITDAALMALYGQRHNY